MKRRFYQGMLILALLCGAVLLAHPEAARAEGVTYLDEQGESQTYTGTYTEVTAQDQQWAAGWYVVKGDVTIGSETEPVRVTVSGDVHLILTDGSTLTVTGGIEVQDDDNNLETPSPNSLTIYAQSTGDSMGRLTASGGKNQAGIGGTGTYDGSVSTSGDGGIITINGGRVTATGGDGGAGIGGGSCGDGGTITINGGNVTAIGNDYSAGIGGSGAGGSGGTITIKNGNVTATSVGGAGIGGGNDGVGGLITIYDGTIEATSVDGAGIGGVNGGAGGSIIIHDGSIEATSVNGAGIGGGRFGGTSSGNITIHGGNIYAANENGGAGIGAGDHGKCGNISITGGIIMATNELDGYGIGGYNGSGTISISDGMVMASGEVAGIGDYYGSLAFVTQTDDGASGQAVIVASSIEDQSGKEAWSGVIFEGDAGYIYGSSVTPKADFNIPAGKTLTITEGQTLTIDNGITAINHGTINNNGTITISVSGTFNNSGEMTGNNPEGTVEAVPKLEQSTFTYTGDDLFDSLKLTPNESGWSLETLKIVDAGVYTVYATKGTDRIPYTVTVRPIVLTVTGATVADKIFDERLWAEVKEIHFASESGEVSLTMPTDYGVSAWFETPEAGVDKVVDVNLWLNNKNYKFETGSYATYQTTATIYGIAANGTIQSGRSGAVTLPALPEGASYGTPTTADTAAVQDLSITDNVLYYSGSSIRDGATYTVSVPVTGATNFNDYTITVTLTGYVPSTPVTPSTPEPPADSEETVTNPDGSTTTTITKEDGSTSTTTVSSDGKVEAEVTLSDEAIAESTESGDAAVALPVPEMTASSDRDTAPTVTVHLPENTTTSKVDIPVENVTAGTVAVLVHEDGSEEVLKNTVQTESGISVAVSDGDTLKIVDNSKTFDDVADDYWGAAAIDFATSRELFAGTAENTFSPDSDMTRAMIWSVLARYEGADTTAAEGSAWYAGTQQWAIDNGISDGTNPDDPMTREQFAAMLYRSVGSPAVSGSVGDFGDAASVSSWASDAMIWAVQNGIIGGYEDSTLRPQNTATRTEVAAMLQRYVILNAQ